MALASRPLAAEQKAFYEEQGYLVVPELLSAAELAELHTALAELHREAEGLTSGNEKFWVVPTEDGSRFSVQCIYDPSAYHRALYDLVFNPKILDVVENLIGQNIKFHH